MEKLFNFSVLTSIQQNRILILKKTKMKFFLYLIGILLPLLLIAGFASARGELLRLLLKFAEIFFSISLHCSVIDLCHSLW